MLIVLLSLCVCCETKSLGLFNGCMKTASVYCFCIAIPNKIVLCAFVIATVCLYGLNAKAKNKSNSINKPKKTTTTASTLDATLLHSLCTDTLSYGLYHCFSFLCICMPTLARIRKQNVRKNEKKARIIVTNNTNACLTDRNVMRQVKLSVVVIIVLCSNDVRSPSLLQPNY